MSEINWEEYQKELQKEAKESCFQQRGVTPDSLIGGHLYCDGFIAGAKHQDSISRKDEEKSELILGFLKYLRNQNEHEFKLRDSNGDILHFSEDREIFIEENLKRYLASLETTK